MFRDLPQRYAFVADLNALREALLSRVNAVENAVDSLAETRASRYEVDRILQSKTELVERIDVLESRVSQLADEIDGIDHGDELLAYAINLLYAEEVLRGPAASEASP